ncbi:MAG: hypothetical protein KJ804_15655 [Proteobacteria bacterium]|nr:hypothetical protein [Pseudomonadota bacterium]MBU1059747.1 hypothetical protein [Pseudomonadota bacterium]
MKRLFPLLRNTLRLLPLILVLSAASLVSEVPARPQPLILIVSSSQLPPYQQVVQGFNNSLKQRFPEALINTFFLDHDLMKTQATLLQIKTRHPDTLFTLGTKATQEMQAMFPDRPQVVTMILDGQLLEHSQQSTGVVLNFPPKVHFDWLRRLLPEAKRVCLLYNPAENAPLFAELEKAAKNSQLELYGIPVERLAQLPAALKSVSRHGDILLGLPDKTVYSSKTAKAILLSTFRNRIPFAGLSRYWVKAGALYALDWDYLDLGRQCGEMMVQILEGTAVADIAPAIPAAVRYVINMKTAEHLRLTLDPSVVQEATEVFQ